MTKFTIAAAALAAGLLVQTQGHTQALISASTANHSGTTSDPEKEVRKTWHAVMRNIPMPGTGCFHARYPDVAWESVECKAAKPRAYHGRSRPSIGAPANAGYGVDFFAGSTGGLIYQAAGRFFVSGVTSETNVATLPPPNNGILGPNDYSLQLNTNTAYTPACQGNGSCTVWQQFIYATDTQSGFAVVFMQYWLWGWSGNCPSGFTSPPDGPAGECYMNSQEAVAPVIPVTNLNDLTLEGWTSPGGGAGGLGDCVVLDYEEGISAICSGTSVLDIGTVWTQAEFNVVGDLELSQAQFNPGSQITVQLGIENGSENPYPPGGPAAVACLPGTGAYASFPGEAYTEETNNLTLGTCQTGLGPVGYVPVTQPYIEFTENYPVPSIPCLTCGGGGNPRPPTPPIRE
jgi:hypothetical protein